MSATGEEINDNLAGEIGGRRRRQQHRRWIHNPPINFSSGGTTTDGSVLFSDSGEDRTVRPAGEVSIVKGEGDEVDLESGELEMEVHYYGKKKKKKRRKKREKEERECRICHLNLMGNEENEEDKEDDFGGAIQLGCDCKGDLGTAHKKCAETWFKIRGNIICEICGAVALNVAADQIMEALNVAVEQPNDTNYIDGPVAEVNAAREVPHETRFFNGRRMMNVLLVCMIVGFVISWLYHFKILG